SMTSGLRPSGGIDCAPATAGAATPRAHRMRAMRKCIRSTVAEGREPRKPACAGARPRSGSLRAFPPALGVAALPRRETVDADAERIEFEPGDVLVDFSRDVVDEGLEPTPMHGQPLRGERLGRE